MITEAKNCEQLLTESRSATMAEDFQYLYDDYVEQFGKPTLPKHLISFAKQNGKKNKIFSCKTIDKN